VSYRILADENVDQPLVTGLREAGHDVEHVDQHPALGKGTDDGTIAARAIETDRLLLTNDDDFLREFDADDRPPLLFIDSGDMADSEIRAIVEEIASSVPQSEIDDVLFVSRNWL
jgi:predicted nuclease of predicted toxin-antitoxin system